MPFKDPEKKKQYRKEYGKKNNHKIWLRRKNNSSYRAYTKAYMKKYSKEYEKTPQKRLSATKYQARKRNLECSITLEEFELEISKPCEYCNNLLGQKSIFASGLDRKNNDEGYTPNNICSCCWVCNSIKGEHLSFEEMKETVKLILKMRGLDNE